MPTRTFVTSKSTLLADYGSTELGGGQDDHLPIGGPWNGYTFRSLVQFTLDYATMRKITSAVLRMRTSGQVDVGFSSAPDFYVSRCTQSWTANSGKSSSDSGGGPGWKTDPSVYPGPSVTTSGRVSKRAPTAEGSTFDTDITAHVKAWAPASVEGGGAATNYGLMLHYVASGDVTEVSSHQSTYAPTIIVTFETDAPPVAATPTAPTGTTTSKRPPITGTGSDPDGDAITSYGLEVRSGTTVVYSVTTGAGASYSHTPTTDLPSGALTVRARATAAGVTGAWSADRAFTIDRPPTVASWSAPAATVTGTRRPVHTFSWSDLDGDPGELFDVAVYLDAGGGVAGTYVTGATNITVAGGTSPCSWSPTVDLPGGPLLARSRVRTKGVWSAWSAYRAYTVVLTVPTLTWDWPEYDGGWSRRNAGNFNDPVGTLADKTVQVATIKYAPPSGTTITTATAVKVEVEDPGIGGPAVGTVIRNNPIGAQPGGATYTYQFDPSSVAAGWISGTLKVTFTIVAANGGQTIETRRARFAGGEWLGAVALGDQVTGLTASSAAIADRVALAYRAQTSATAPAPGAVWALAVPAVLPAANAYLGIRSRISRQADDSQIVANPSFEDGLAGWSAAAGRWDLVDAPVNASAPDGGRVLTIKGDGVANYMAMTQRLQVGALIIPGATYKISGWIYRGGGGTQFGAISLRQRDASGAAVGADIAAAQNNTAAWVYGEGWWTVPADGSVTAVDVYCTHQQIPTATQIAYFDNVRLQGPALGDAGLDRIDLAWTSLG